MITVKIEGLDKISAMLADAPKKINYAAASAMNDVAFQIRAKEQELITQVFDRPRPQTIKNIFVNKARKDNLQATIRFDQIYSTDAWTLTEYMKVHTGGGSRAMKPSERRLNNYYVPGSGAKLDKYGNLKGGFVTQILSRMGRFGDVSGYDMNETANSRKRRSGRSKMVDYIMITKHHGKLMPGIYQRQASAYKTGVAPARGTMIHRRSMKGGPAGAWERGASKQPVVARGLVPVLVFTKRAPTYRKRFPFFEVGEQMANQLMPAAIDKAVAYYLGTSW